jgi:hypothetical protein
MMALLPLPLLLSVLLPPLLLLLLSNTDPLVQHHQQLRDGAAADGLLGHHPDARAQGRLCKVQPRGR